MKCRDVKPPKEPSYFVSLLYGVLLIIIVFSFWIVVYWLGRKVFG